MGPILILGATSTIADAIAREFASHDSNLVLVARNVDELESRASDLRLRYGVTVRTLQFDALAFETHSAVIESCMNGSDDPPEGAILCFGYLGDQRLAQEDFSEGRTIFDTNFTAAVSLIEVLAGRFEERKSGFICALSSVAGDRGRQSNYMYGASKGALSRYLQGLRNRLAKSNVRVITIKPGIVDTRMTYGHKASLLMSSPERVAKGVYAAIKKRKDVAYVPWFWRPLMFVIRNIPERIFKRLSL